jgi:hypothetical protein
MHSSIMFYFLIYLYKIKTNDIFNKLLNFLTVLISIEIYSISYLHKLHFHPFFFFIIIIFTFNPFFKIYSIFSSLRIFTIPLVIISIFSFNFFRHPLKILLIFFGFLLFLLSLEHNFIITCIDSYVDYRLLKNKCQRFNIHDAW